MLVHHLGWACVLRFHEYWLDAARARKVALHVVKYEELLTAP